MGDARTWPHPWGDLKPLGFFEWAKVVRRTNLPTGTKAVALVLGLYADTQTGSKARPGQARIAREANMSERNVRRHLAELERCGFLHCLERGNNVGISGVGTRYQLTALADLIEEIEATSDLVIIDLTGGHHRTPVSSGDRTPVSSGWSEAPDKCDTTTGQIEQTTGQMEQDHRTPVSAYLSMTSPVESPHPISSGQKSSSDESSAIEAELVDEDAPGTGWNWGKPWGSAPKAADTRLMCIECRWMYPPEQIARIEQVGRVCESCRQKNGWAA